MRSNVYLKEFLLVSNQSENVKYYFSTSNIAKQLKIITPPLTPMGKELNEPTVSHACRMKRLKGDWSRWQRVYGVGLHWPPV